MPRYPQLQAIQEFKDLSVNLSSTEDAIASLFGFGPEQFFELAEPAERAAPMVKFALVMALLTPIFDTHPPIAKRIERLEAME